MKLPRPVLALMLWAFGGGTATAYAVTEREAVAATLVLEAGGTGTRGMEAVMWVIRNRCVVRRKSPLAIVTAKRQFAVMRGGAAVAIRKARAHPRWEEALRIYDRWHDMRGFTRYDKDPTRGALYFESYKNKVPLFFKTLTPTIIVGGNQFYAP